MRRPRRIFVTIVTTIAALATMTVPALASDDAGASSCVVAGGQANSVRAFLTPTSAIAEDVAFNHDDPDAEDSPLELIRYPDEAALWIGSGAGAPSTLSPGSDTAAVGTRAFAFTGPDRDDREVSDSIVRLYCGLFDRQPDAFELEYWAGRYWNGLPLVTIAEAFTQAQEFVDRFGVVSDEALVDLMYREVLGREPGVGGTEMLAAQLESGAIHRGQAIVQFTESGEYVRMTGTAAPEKPPLPYPDVGSGRRIILTESGQRVWMVEASGELYKTHQVSGRRGIPGVGRYNVYSKSRYAWAPYDGITMEFMVRFARGEWPYGFHSIPVWPDEAPLQTPAQLGTHRSGGCIRQLWDDSEALFEWSEVGDRVLLIP